MECRGFAIVRRIARGEVNGLPRQINEPVTVTLTRDPVFAEMNPASFSWRRGRYRVARVLDVWNETGRWWEKEAEMTVWRVICHDGGTYELGKVHSEPPQWLLLVSHD